MCKGLNACEVKLRGSVLTGRAGISAIAGIAAITVQVIEARRSLSVLTKLILTAIDLPRYFYSWNSGQRTHFGCCYLIFSPCYSTKTEIRSLQPRHWPILKTKPNKIQSKSHRHRMNHLTEALMLGCRLFLPISFSSTPGAWQTASESSNNTTPKPSGKVNPRYPG